MALQLKRINLNQGLEGKHHDSLATPFFDYPPPIRKVIYTTNAIESLNASLRKVTKNRKSFPTNESVMKLLYLTLHQISKKWTLPIRD